MNNLYGRLYEIKEDYTQIMDFLYNDVIPKDMSTLSNADKDVIAEILGGMNVEITDIAEDIGKIVRELETDAEKIKSEANRLYEKSVTYSNRALSLKEYLKETMEFTGNTKIKGDLFTFSVCKNGGKQPFEYTVDDIEDIPAEYKKTKTVVEADVEKIRQSLSEGEVLDFAVLKPRGTHLRIK